MKILVDVVDCYNLLGAAQKNQGRYVEALNAFQKGLGLARTLKDTSQIATLLINKAEINNLQGEEKEGLASYREGLKLIRLTAGEESFAAAVVYNNLGELQSVGHDSALVYLHRAKKIFQTYGYADGEAHTLSNLGEHYVELGDFFQAIPLYEGAIEIWGQESIHFKPGLMEAYGGLAEAHLGMGQIAQARVAIQQGLAVGEEGDLKPNLKRLYEVGSRVEERAGNLAQSLTYLKTSQAISEEILDETRTKELALSRIRFETEEKEKELAQSKLELAEGNLELIRQKNQRNILFLLAIILVLGLIGIFWFFRYRQKVQQREASLALQAREAEAASLRELDLMKSRFFANISHEFRTPLTLILGPVKRLLADKAVGSHLTQYRLIQRNAERLLHLINQLLDLSKLESGKLGLQLERGDVVSFLRTLAGQFESWAISKEIRYHQKFPSEPILTAFDPEKLNQTLSNLLSNAFKYTPEGGDVWLTVSRDEGNLEIQVRDNGLGMDDDELAQIWDRFYQAGRDDYSGTGIGLSLVKELVDLYQGEVLVSSEPGKGSLFRVLIPLMTGETLLPLQNTEPTVMAGGATSFDAQVDEEVSSVLPNQARILIAEDNPDIRQYLKSVLEKDYVILEARDGQEALEEAQKQLPDLLISDIMMPRLDGYALTKAIKQDLRTSHIPVIQLTAKAGRESLIEGLEAQADDYLTKPFDEEELLLRVRNRLEQRKALSQQLGKEIVRLSPQDIAVKSADKVFLERVIQTAEHYLHDESFTIEDLGREVGLSRSQLHRKLKALTDQSPSIFLRTLRLKRAHQLLSQSAGTAAEIAYQVGFGSPAYFSKCYKDQFGVTPMQKQD